MNRSERELITDLWRHIGETCFYCSEGFPRDSITGDHVFPRRLGYSAMFNLVPSCKPCNEDKADEHPDLDLIERVQALYDAAGKTFDPHLKGPRPMSVASVWGKYCSQAR